MLTKNTIKQIQLLKTNKGRIQERKYIIEGKRCVLTYINNNEDLITLFMTKDFLTKNKELVKKWGIDILNIQIISFDLFLRGIITPKGLTIYEKTLKTLKP